MHDVIVAGAGPVGLFLACELGLRGVSVLVLERAADPESPLKRLPFGMRGLTLPSVEALYRRGLLDEALARSPSLTGLRQAGGHFAGIPFDARKVDRARWVYKLPSPADAGQAIETGHLETVLAARAHALGVEIRRGQGVDDVAAEGDEVTVRAGDQSFRASWLVGCDGARSVVRKAGGFVFAGTAPECTGYSFRVDLDDPEKLALGRHLTPTGMYIQAQPGHFGVLEFDGGAFHRTELGPGHLQDVLRRVSGTDVTVTAVHAATTWTDRAQQASTYRDGRVLLAGDAAHIHAPLGGQGLNLGLGDAMNLGWKLAATIHETAPAGLLDSYERERMPVGLDVLEWSRAQIAVMRPGPQAHALQHVVRDLAATTDGATYFAERVLAASLRYDLGDAHPLVGRSVPELTMDDGTTLGVQLRDGRGAVVDFDGDHGLQALAERHDLRHVHISTNEASERLQLGALLVRPDGVVAWVRRAGATNEGADAAATRWFGGALSPSS